MRRGLELTELLEDVERVYDAFPHAPALALCRTRQPLEQDRRVRARKALWQAGQGFGRVWDRIAGVRPTGGEGEGQLGLDVGWDVGVRKRVRQLGMAFVQLVIVLLRFVVFDAVVDWLCVVGGERVGRGEGNG